MFKKILIAIIIILLIGAFFIQKDTGLDTKEQKVSFVKSMSSWVGNLFGNAKDITAYATKKNWKPDVKNSTE